MRSQTDGSPWTARRATRGGGTDVPVTRPERLRAVPLDDLAENLAAWTAAVAKARAAYYHDTRGKAHRPDPPDRSK